MTCHDRRLYPGYPGLYHSADTLAVERQAWDVRDNVLRAAAGMHEHALQGGFKRFPAPYPPRDLSSWHYYMTGYLYIPWLAYIYHSAALAAERQAWDALKATAGTSAPCLQG